MPLTDMVKALNPGENKLTHPSLWDGLVAIWMPTSYGMLEVRPKAGSIRVIPTGAGLKLLVHKV